MRIVINSHIHSNIALTHLLESLKLCNEYIYYDIIVAIGGYYNIKDYEINKIDNITYIKCNHNSIDYTGLIMLYEVYKDIFQNEHYVYLHDTCKVGKNFLAILNRMDITNVTSIKINKMFSMNIGIYSQKIINEFSDFLLIKKNIDNNKLMEYKLLSHEDYIFNNDKNNILLDNYNGYNATGPTDYYGTGTMRIVEYYPNLDLYKIKANWGQVILR
jgi:hypothetical protein